ncbi:hypothetical protein HCH_06344 [Hahella chejuensis KCTC 2396]|uniref:Uncharacterized protein n=1 Tax=Hahella chejuensis (strain KCTC 2396) TaxID=349521 RepID=Q2S8N4_HAHCH|nr:hypothetical protein HCH_06344 [Hahella chejuensis KCTC 2396]
MKIQRALDEHDSSIPPSIRRHYQPVSRFFKAALNRFSPPPRWHEQSD